MLAALLLLVAQLVPAPAEVRTFRDWVVGCDNGRRCQALALHPEGADYDGDPPTILFVEREPAAGAAPTFRLVDLEQRPERLLIDGQRVAVDIESTDGEWIVRPREPAAFAATLRNGARLELQNAAGARLGTVSLAGASAAMLYMDEQQRRAGTVTALVRPGGRASASVPAPPPLPLVRPAPQTSERALTLPPARIAELRRTARCVIGDVGGPDEAITAALGGGRTLVLLTCGTGAYNVTMVPFIARRQGRRIVTAPAPFDTPLEAFEREEGRRMLINADYDPASRTLSDFPRGRGLGDCGTRSQHVWDGLRFRLIRRESMPECRGSIVYVTTWRAQAR